METPLLKDELPSWHQEDPLEGSAAPDIVNGGVGITTESSNEKSGSNPPWVTMTSASNQRQDKRSNPESSKDADMPSWAVEHDDEDDYNDESGELITGGGEDLPKMILFMRMGNIVASFLLVFSSVTYIIGIHAPHRWILALYALCGGILVCCLELQLPFLRATMAVNFGFLFNPVLRLLFYVLMALIEWSYGTFSGKVVAFVLGATSAFNTWVLVRYPAYREMRDRIADEEHYRIQSTVRNEIQKQALTHLLQE